MRVKSCGRFTLVCLIVIAFGLLATGIGQTAILDPKAVEVAYLLTKGKVPLPRIYLGTIAMAKYLAQSTPKVCSGLVWITMARTTI